MPFIDKIVENINTDLRTNIFSKGSLSPSQVLGLGYIQKREQSEGRFDYVIQGIDETDMTPDDAFSCKVYHRMLNGTFAQIKNQSFGDEETQASEPTNMTMVIWAKRSIGIHESTLASWIADVLNKNYSNATLTDFQLSKLQTRAVSVTYDSQQVWVNEYKNTNYPFGVEEIMFFSIQYVIESTYSKGCFNTCPDC